MDTTIVNVNYSWKFQDDMMRETLSKSVTDGQTDKWMEGQMNKGVHKAAWSQLKIKHTPTYNLEPKYNWDTFH